MTERLSERFGRIGHDPSAEIDDAHSFGMKRDLVRLKSGEPIQYVLGNAHFFGMELMVDHRVLIPRPETEEMVEMIASQKGFEPSTVVDVCTGSGCIALGLKKSFPAARVIALDVDSGAIEVAHRNSISNGIELEFGLVDVIQAGWSDELPKETHLVVSNPPYILPTEAKAMHVSVLKHEPSIALFVPQDDSLLFYKPIATYAKNTLVEGGQLWFEINPAKAADVIELLNSIGFGMAETVKDLSGKVRFAKAIQ